MNGTFKKCTNCILNKNCCSDFNKIDYPILSKEEIDFITKKYGAKDDYFKYIKNDCFNLVAKNGVCPFYENKCTIYENRPYDCKLFPFDIKIINNKYYLIIYKIGCINYNEMLDENVDDIIDNIKPYIKTFTDRDLNKKMQLLDYDIVKEIYV